MAAGADRRSVRYFRAWRTRRRSRGRRNQPTLCPRASTDTPEATGPTTRRDDGRSRVRRRATPAGPTVVGARPGPRRRRGGRRASSASSSPSPPPTRSAACRPTSPVRWDGSPAPPAPRRSGWPRWARSSPPSSWSSPRSPPADCGCSPASSPGASLAAGVTSLLGHSVIDDAQPASWQAVVARESWITGRAFPTSAYLAGAVATVVVVVRWLGPRWSRTLWAAVAVLAVVRVVSGTNLPLDLVVAFGVGVAGGSAALLVVGSPDLSPSGAAVAAALRRAGVGLTDADRGGRAAGRHPRLPGDGTGRRSRGRRPQRRRPRPRRRRPAVRPPPHPHRARGELLVSVEEATERAAFDGPVARPPRPAGRPTARRRPAGHGRRPRRPRSRRRGRALSARGDDLSVDEMASAWRAIALLHAGHVAHGALDLDAVAVDDDGRAWLQPAAGRIARRARRPADDRPRHLPGGVHAGRGGGAGGGGVPGRPGRRRAAGDAPLPPGAGAAAAHPAPAPGDREGGQRAARRRPAGRSAPTRSSSSDWPGCRRRRCWRCSAACWPSSWCCRRSPTSPPRPRRWPTPTGRGCCPCVGCVALGYVASDRHVPGGDAGAAPVRAQPTSTQLAAATLNRVTPNGLGGLGTNIRFLQRSGYDTTQAGDGHDAGVAQRRRGRGDPHRGVRRLGGPVGRPRSRGPATR